MLDRYGNKKTHKCGCVTHFDTHGWVSKAISRCTEHSVFDVEARNS